MTRHFQALGPVIRLFLHERRGMLMAGAALAGTTAVAGIALLGVSGWFITATAIAGLVPATAWAFDVFAPSAAIRMLALTRTAARYGERLTTHEATLSVLAALRTRLFLGWAVPGAAGRLADRPARLLHRLTDDIDALDSLYLRVLVPAAVSVLSALLVGISLAFLHPLAGLLTGLFLLTAGLGIPVAAALRSEKLARQRTRGLEALRARTIDLVAGQTELVMAGRMTAQQDAILKAEKYLATADNGLNRIEANAGLASGIASAVLLAAALAGAAWLEEQYRIGAPAVALMLLVCLAALEPFAALRRGATELGRTLMAARRIAPRLTAAPPRPSRALPSTGLAAELEDISVCRENRAVPVLRIEELDVQEGERIAVIGESGAGKSTLLALLAGELLPACGEIRNLRATLLTQRNELFSDSLRDNLRLAAPAADDGQLIAALDAAGLATDVAAMPQGLETRLGEGGMGLSGGQSRRLALARFLLRDTPLWLLDEPTEGVDGDTARDVMLRISEHAQGHTLLIATHIRREAELADRILLMGDGRIMADAQRGTQQFTAMLEALRPD